MPFDYAADEFIAHKKRFGYFASERTETAYRATLRLHAIDVGERVPADATRDDVMRTLSRWENPNTLRKRLSHLRSFYRWAMQEGIRADNPAEQVPAIRARPTSVYRLSRDETAAILLAARTTREKRIVRLGIGAGLRNSELRGMQGRHFERPGFIWVSPDIGKGGKGRWVPVIADLEDVVQDIRETVDHDEYVIPARRWHGWGEERRHVEYPQLPCSAQALLTTVADIGRRAGVAGKIHPHLMRHAFGDHAARRIGLKATQEALGHTDVSTTQRVYTGKFTPDEMAEAFAGFSFLDEDQRR